MASLQTNIPLVFAGNLHGNDGRQLDLTYKQEPSGAYVQVAKLPEVSSFNVTGTFNTACLDPGTYKAAFVIKIEGNHSPNEKMKVGLTLNRAVPSNEPRRTVDRSLSNQDRDNWINIESDPFENRNEEDFVFRMTKVGNNVWNEHVFVNGIVVKPCNMGD